MRSKEWLTRHGYDGLCGYECGCALDDLMPCGEPDNDCKPGYFQHHKRSTVTVIDGDETMCGGGEFCGCLGPRKPAPKKKTKGGKS